ncbi:MAG: restriction endonuclease subunit S [Eubacterium sp.]|nr:restriction endonuclease subunit S [Eubacterium sp.]
MERIRLGEVCEVVSGSTPKTEVAEYWNGDIDWITPAELTDETYIIEESQRKITDVAVKKTGLRPFPKGTVILSSRAPIGKVAIAGKEMYCNQGFKNMICCEKIDNRYLYWFLKGRTDYLNSLGRGATFKEISKSIVENIEIPLPDLDRQIGCAKILNKCQSLVLLHKERIKQLNNLIQSRFVEMFGDLRINSMNWEMKTFDELTDFITDGEHITPRRVEKGIYLLSARNVLNHSLQLDDVDYIDQGEYDRISKRVVPQEGDVLISCSGTVGRCCSVPSDMKFQMVRSVALLRFKNGINPIFAEYMITSDYLQDQINSAKTASAQANLFQGKIAKLRGFVPTMDRQEEFLDFVRQVDKLKLKTQTALNETQTLMDSLMQEYFG